MPKKPTDRKLTFAGLDIDEARAAIGRVNLDAETEARMDRIVAAAERALEAGKFQGDEG